MFPPEPEPPAGGRRPLSPLDAALIAEACTKSDLIWLRPAGAARYAAVWHVWHDDAVCVLSGGGEQALPDLAGGGSAAVVEVVARSKETGARVVGFEAEPSLLRPRSAEWEHAAFALAAARLNAVDPQHQQDRWARGSAVTLLRPVAVTAAGGGEDDAAAGTRPPPRGPGTTVTHAPFHLGGRRRRAARRRGH